MATTRLKALHRGKPAQQEAAAAAAAAEPFQTPDLEFCLFI